MTECERNAKLALDAAIATGAEFGQFMKMMPEVARADGDHAEFVRLTAPLLLRSDALFHPWAAKIFNAVHFGNEHDAIVAVLRRSQLELACELYRGSSAEPMLDAGREEELDRELAERAKLFCIAPEEGIPRSHFWWAWSE